MKNTKEVLFEASVNRPKFCQLVYQNLTLIELERFKNKMTDKSNILFLTVMQQNLVFSVI